MRNGAATTAGGSPLWRRAGVTFLFDDTDGGLVTVAEVLLQVTALAPGPEAISLLHGLAGREMAFTESLQVIELWQAQKAWMEGAEQAALLAYAGPTPDPADKNAVVEDEFNPGPLARVLNSSTHHAFDRVFFARKLSTEFTDLGDQLRAGALDPYRVHIILDTLLTFANREHALTVQAQILPVAAGLTPTKLRKTLRRLAREADPDWNTQMFTQARKTRRVVFDPQGQDGLVGMHAYLPPVEAVAMQQHLEQAAQTGPVDENDERGHDARMADALIGAVLGTVPGDPSTPMSPDVTVNVFLPAPLLLGLQNTLEDTTKPAGVGATARAREGVGQLAGYGDYPAELLRDLAADATWRRWVLEPVTGHLLDLGKHRYRPSAELAEYVRVRDRYCRHPGCNRTARRGDLDHLDPFDHDDPDSGGSTSATNLAAECRHHHRGKTLKILKVTGDPNDTLTWTDQNGHTGETEPHNYGNGL